MTRHTIDRQKKLRGIPRRIRALKKWSQSFENNFPSEHELSQNLKYRNYKIPIHWALVEGRESTLEIKKQCIQFLINACHHLINSKPDWAKKCRVTCCISYPNLFSSEVCIYLDEDYYKNHTEPQTNELETKARIIGKSLAKDLGLDLPEKIGECGICCDVQAEDDSEARCTTDFWYYGEVTLG